MNLPNKISLTRICMIPVVVVVFLLEYYAAAAIIFAVAALTDFLDGTIARKYNLVTTLGKFLDPIADKVIVVVGLFLIVYGELLYEIKELAVICCIIILSRELIIGAFRQIAVARQVVLAADNLGKAKTVVTDVAIPFLFIADLSKVHLYIGMVLFLLGTLLTIVSGIHYVIKNRQVLATADDGSKKESVAASASPVAEDCANTEEITISAEKEQANAHFSPEEGQNEATHFSPAAFFAASAVESKVDAVETPSEESIESQLAADTEELTEERAEEILTATDAEVIAEEQQEALNASVADSTQNESVPTTEEAVTTETVEQTEESVTQEGQKQDKAEEITD